jgi:hypothetical protein
VGWGQHCQVAPWGSLLSSSRCQAWCPVCARQQRPWVPTRLGVQGWGVWGYLGASLVGASERERVEFQALGCQDWEAWEGSGLQWQLGLRAQLLPANWYPVVSRHLQGLGSPWGLGQGRWALL